MVDESTPVRGKPPIPLPDPPDENPSDLVMKIAEQSLSNEKEGRNFIASKDPVGRKVLIDSFYAFIGLGTVNSTGVSASNESKVGMLEVEDCVADISWGFRGLWDLVGALNPSSREDPVATHAMTIAAETSVLSGVSAFYAWMGARQELKEVQQGVIHDAFREKETQAKVATSGVKVAANVTLTGYRQLSLASFIQGVEASHKATSPLGRATFFTGFAGVSLAATFLSLFTIYGSVSFTELLRFGKECPLEHYDNVREFFENELSVTPVDTYKTLEDISTKEGKSIKDLLGEEARAKVAEYVDKVKVASGKKVVGEAIVSDEEIKTFLQEGGEHSIDSIKRCLQEWLPEGQHEFVKEKELNDIELLGFYIACNKEKTQKRDKIERCLGKDILNRIDEILDGGELSEPEQKEFLAEVQNALFSKGIWQVFLLGVLSLSTVTLGLIGVSFFVTAPAMLLAASLANVVVGFVTIIMDVCSIGGKYLEEGVVSLREKIMASSNLLIGIGSFIAVCVLTATSLGTVPAIIAITITTFWVILSIADLAALYFKNKQHYEANLPKEELFKRYEELKTRVSKEGGSEEMRQLSAKVKISFQKALQNSLLTEEMKKDVIKKIPLKNITAINKANLEELKGVLEDWEQKEEELKAALGGVEGFFPKEIEEETILGSLGKKISEVATWMKNPLPPEPEAS